MRLVGGVVKGSASWHDDVTRNCIVGPVGLSPNLGLRRFVATVSIQYICRADKGHFY